MKKFSKQVVCARFQLPGKRSMSFTCNSAFEETFEEVNRFSWREMQLQFLLAVCRLLWIVRFCSYCSHSPLYCLTCKIICLISCFSIGRIAWGWFIVVVFAGEINKNLIVNWCRLEKPLQFQPLFKGPDENHVNFHLHASYLTTRESS